MHKNKSPDFLDPQRRAGPWGHVFSPGAVLRVTGTDALSFLQGQITQELRSPVKTFAAYGLWLNQKGKVLADSFVLRESPESLCLVSYFSKASTLRERLESYVIADDVAIEDATDRWSGLAVGGRGADEWLAARFGVAAPGPGEFARTADGVFIFQGRRGEAPAWECLLPAGTARPDGLAWRTAEEMERARIAAGVAAVPADIGPGELPNEGGLDAAAVSYTKGCYLGQEVMARLKAMGTLRRRLVRVAGGGAAPAVPCALLQGGARVGELRSAAEDGAGGFIGLALVTTLRLDAGAPLAPEPGGEANIHLIDTP